MIDSFRTQIVSDSVVVFAIAGEVAPSWRGNTVKEVQLLQRVSEEGSGSKSTWPIRHKLGTPPCAWGGALHHQNCDEEDWKVKN